MNKRLYVIIAALGVMLAACSTDSESTTTTVAEATTTSEAEGPTRRWPGSRPGHSL